MKHYLLLAVLFFSIVCTAQDYELLIEVWDEKMESPIEGAKIQINYKGQTLSFDTKSDGKLLLFLKEKFEGVEPGTSMKIRILAKNYQSQRKECIIPKSEFSKPLEFRLALKKKAITYISGYVKDEQGSFLSEVEVRYRTYVTSSQIDGYFELKIPDDKLPHSEARITFVKEELQGDTAIVINRQKHQEELIFILKPKPLFAPTDTEGYTYAYKELAALLWTTENLKTSIDNADFNKQDTKQQFGRLYTWDEAKRACNSLGNNWRLPSETEWNALLKHYDYDAIERTGDAANAAKELKEAPFEAKAAGRFLDNHYKDFGDKAYYWTSTPKDDKKKLYAFYVEIKKENIFLRQEAIRLGFSCRCVRNLKQ